MRRSRTSNSSAKSEPTGIDLESRNTLALPNRLESSPIDQRGSSAAFLYAITDEHATHCCPPESSDHCFSRNGDQPSVGWRLPV